MIKKIITKKTVVVGIFVAIGIGTTVNAGTVETRIAELSRRRGLAASEACMQAHDGTFTRVLRGLRLLQKYKIEYNVMACVGRNTAEHPVDVYLFFKDEGVDFIQFTPIRARSSSIVCYGGCERTVGD